MSEPTKLNTRPGDNLVLLPRERYAVSDEYPGSYQGRGIVICAGGVRHFTNAYVAVQLLRDHGCELPIELWYCGDDEVSADMRAVIAPFGVDCVDAKPVLDKYPGRQSIGRDLRLFALIFSGFRDVLMIDADNLAILDPTYLFRGARCRFLWTKTGSWKIIFVRLGIFLESSGINYKEIEVIRRP